MSRMKRFKFPVLICMVCTFYFSSCKGDLEMYNFDPTPYIVQGTETLGPLPIPEDNQMTQEGIKLGQHLFFDKLLSGDNTMSCASCHHTDKGFTDGNDVSVGIEGIAGTRSSMSLVNAAYYTKGLFWDGRSETLEEQALLPVEDPIEMHAQWTDVIEKLKAHDDYPKMFREAFGIKSSDEIDEFWAAKALAQFERAIISDSWVLSDCSWTKKEYKKITRK